MKKSLRRIGCLMAIVLVGLFAACSESEQAVDDVEDAAGHAADAMEDAAEGAVDAVDDAADEIDHEM